MLHIGTWIQPTTRAGLDYVIEADRLGARTAWTPEAWGFDAFTPLAAAASVTENIRLGTAIAQLGARTPAMLAMSAMTMQHLSDGRFLLGIGTSGPQVMEGWHGQRFDRPVTRTRETIDIIRLIASGERLAYEGDAFTLPLADSQGRALRSMVPPVDIPIYVASLGPRNLQLTGELADGWIGNSFFCETADAYFDEIAKGTSLADRSSTEIDRTVSVSVEFTDDVEEAAQRHASGYAFTFGAMGSADNNFYNNAFERQGWGDDVRAVQQLWLSGDREAAAARVPLEIGLRTNLIGTPDMVKQRLAEYRDCGVDELRVSPVGATLDEQVDNLGMLLELTAEVSRQ